MTDLWSARPVADPRPCELPYGLTWIDLEPCLPGFTSADGAQAWVSHEKQGLNGGESSAILTLDYRADAKVEGVRRRHTAFVKQTVEPARREAAKYRALAEAGIDGARLLLSVERAGAEVIVLEFLPRIGYQGTDADVLLRMIAAVNAVTGGPAGVFAPVPGKPTDEFDAGVRTALADAALPEPGRCFAGYRWAVERLASMPRALNHGELAPQQVGWAMRHGRQVPMPIDLETMAVLPLLTDVASVLRGLADASGRDERELFSVYLAELAAVTGRAADGVIVEASWTDLLTTRVVHSAESLPWLVTMSDHPDVAGAASSTARLLVEDLSALRLL